MNLIYIMVKVDSDQSLLLLSQYDKNECSCYIENISQENYENNNIEECNKNLVFVFPIDKHKTCKDFLKRCYDNPMYDIKLDIKNITLQTRISQSVDGLHLDKT